MTARYGEPIPSGTAPAPRATRLGGPLGVSVLLHAAVLGLALWTFRSGAPEVLPPVYKVSMVAAPPGERAIGEVNAGPAPANPSEAPAQTRETPPEAPTVPTKRPAPVAAPKATPNTAPKKPAAKPGAANAKNLGTKPNTAAPKAGGGPHGGRGSDVANVNTGGIDFPFPGYLHNIVQQIALNFHPRNPDAPLRADVSFLIHRDGSVTNVRFVTKSGIYTFDLEAQGAVERGAKSFGPLPDGFRDDVLPVVFSFSPEFLR